MSDTPARKKLVDYLVSQGVDPSEVPVDGYGRYGYVGFGEKEMTPWPEGFDYTKLVELVREVSREVSREYLLR